MTNLVIDNSVRRVTQHFGNGHKGVDLGYSKDESKNVVYANSFGVVIEVVDRYTNNTKATGSKSWGNYVLIKHPNGYYSRYAHLQKGSIKVKVNQNVDEHTELGIIGDSGRAYGRHLHFEVATGYSSNTRINPEPYLVSPVYTKTKNDFKVGEYTLLYSKAIRRTHELTNNIVLVKDCMTKIKPLLTSKKPNDNAYFKVGVKVKITDIYVDKTTRVWGKLTNTWIVLQNKDGKKQVK